MKRAVLAVVAVLAVFVAFAIVVGLTSSSNWPHRQHHVAGKPTVTPPSPTVTPPSPTAVPVANPHVIYSPGCSYILGKSRTDLTHGYRFVADAFLQNRGNVGTTVVVKASWDLAGRGPIVRSKQVQLAWHKSFRVGITVPVSQALIYLYTDQGHGYNCSSKATIVDTFGDIH
ncbi:MAG: hypothetical protein ACRDPG_02045 [Nocardioidaceae bacterium]